MPKHKTHKGALSRFKVTKTGKVMHLSQFGRHGQRKKSPGAKRRHKEPMALQGLVAKKVKRMLGVI